VGSEIAAALGRLTSAAESGELERLCREYDVVLVVVFGSAIDADAGPRDLDVAVRFAPYDPTRVIDFLDRLSALVGSGAVDLLVINNAGPVVRERALVPGIPLYEGQPGAYANAQIAAVMERMETDHMRRLDLELMSG
jgi:predicted nucleotidyltransferase